MTNERLEVLWEGAKGIVTSLSWSARESKALEGHADLEAVDENEEECFAHSRR